MIRRLMHANIASLLAATSFEPRPSPSDTPVLIFDEIDHLVAVGTWDDARRMAAERLGVARAMRDSSPTIPTSRIEECMVVLPDALRERPKPAAPPQTWLVPPAPPVDRSRPRNRAERRAAARRGDR